MKVISVNVARAVPMDIEGRSVLTGIGTRPVAGSVAVGRLGLAGDEQADPSVHGGLSKAVYAYPVLHLPFWRTVRAQARAAAWDSDIAPGMMGENLTVDGIDETRVWVGDRLEGPDCTLVVSEPRFPCFKFAAVMGFAQAAKLMAQSGYCGFYLAVQPPGSIQAGETFRLVPGQRSLSIAQAFAGKRWKHMR